MNHYADKRVPEEEPVVGSDVWVDGRTRVVYRGRAGSLAWVEGSRGLKFGVPFCRVKTSPEEKV